MSKLVDYRGPKSNQTRIKRIFNPKYPYEYLRMAEERKTGVSNRKSLLEEANEFFVNNENQ